MKKPFLISIVSSVAIIPALCGTVAAQGQLDPNTQEILRKFHESAATSGMNERVMAAINLQLNDPAQARKILADESANGSAAAQFSYADMLYGGFGGPRNDDEAFKWLIRSADQGHLAAQDYLCSMFTSGRGVKKDESQQKKWCARPIDSEMTRQPKPSNAATDAALRRIEQRRPGQDVRESFSALAREAGKGFAKAQYGLGQILWTHGNKEDKFAGFFWMMRAGKQGFALAEQRLCGLASNPAMNVPFSGLEMRRWCQSIPAK